jgi:PKD repeat protein
MSKKTLRITLVMLVFSVIYIYSCSYSKVEDVVIPISNDTKADFSVDKTECTTPCTVTCSNKSIGNGSLSYEWNFGDPTSGSLNVSTIKDPTHEYKTAGMFTLTLKTKGQNGENTLTKDVKIIPAGNKPLASFTYIASNNSRANSTVTFTNTSMNSTQYTWSFGDGSPVDTKETPTPHLYNVPGIFDIKLTAKNTTGDTSELIKKIIIRPEACFSVSCNPNTCIAPVTVSFNSVCSKNGDTYSWDFGISGSAGTSTLANPSVNYTLAGTYDVVLVVTKNSATDTVKQRVTIQAPVDPVPNFSVSFSGNNQFAPANIIFTNTSTNAKSYKWYFGNGLGTSLETSPIYTYNVGGSFTITLEAVNVAGVTKSISKIVTINTRKFAKFFGTSNSAVGYYVQQTKDGGYFTCGRITGASGNFDMYVIKTNEDGTSTWIKNIGDANDEIGRSAQQTIDGGYIICGHKNKTGGIDYDINLIKTEANGIISWSNTFGGTSIDYGYSIQQTKDEGYIICGQTYQTGAGDVYILKVDKNGVKTWEKTFGGVNNDSGNAIRQASDGGYILCGETSSEGAGKSDVYLLKTDGTGNLIWKKTFGGINDDRGTSVQQTIDGGYILCGETSSEGAGKSDVYLLKTNSNGDLIWKKTFGGINDDRGASVQQTIDGGYIICGETNSEGAGGEDVYLIKTNANGDLSWKKTIGVGNYEKGFSIQQTTDGGYIICGRSGIATIGGSDLYLIKTDKDGNAQ